MIMTTNVQCCVVFECVEIGLVCCEVRFNDVVIVYYGTHKCVMFSFRCAVCSKCGAVISDMVIFVIVYVYEYERALLCEHFSYAAFCDL